MTTPVPEHITPKAIYDMSSDELDAMLEAMRERRLTSVRIYEAAVKEAQELADEKARAELQKQCDMCASNIERCQKADDALLTRVNKIRALRLQLGLD